MLALAYYLGADVKRFSRRFENGFGISIDELASLSVQDAIDRYHKSSQSEWCSDRRCDHETDRRDRAQCGCAVLVDEVYMETLFEESPRTSFHLGSEFVVTSSLTKAFGLSGLRCGWILAEPELAKRMWLLNDLFASTPVHSGERLSVVAFSSSKKSEHARSSYSIEIVRLTK
jgi:hypothetical protein